MRKLGISIYPNHMNKLEIINYVQKAGRLGYKRIFTGYLNDEKLLEDMKEIFSIAHKYDMEIFMDCTPQILNKICPKGKTNNPILEMIQGPDLKTFYDLGVDGIRMDIPESIGIMRSMTRNPYGIKIEFNSSTSIEMMESIFAACPNRHQMTMCHNFYPRRFSGIPFDDYKKINRLVKNTNLESSTFITSQNKNIEIEQNTIQEGRCTLEIHRYMSLETQFSSLIILDDVDNIIIGNYPATDDELQNLASMDKYIPTIFVELIEDITPIEKEILNCPYISVRRESNYSIRTITRMFFPNADIPPHNIIDIKRGDVFIDNNAYMQYKGDLHFALEDMKNDGKCNVVGRVDEGLIPFLDEIKKGSSFIIKER